MITSVEALFYTEKLLALSVIIQSIEFLLIRSSFSGRGTWRWESLAPEFQSTLGPAQNALGFLLNYKSFLGLIVLRLAAASLLLIFSHAVLVFILLLTTTLILMRWRGSFNGGSDYMTLIVLLAILAARSFEGSHAVVWGALWYISIQVCCSFFIAGFIKLKRKNWRHGIALPHFFKSSIYQTAKWQEFAGRQKGLMKLVSWGVIIFECSFPLALLSPQICLIYMSVGFVFQLGNVYLFGLNRFLYAWLAAYPALFAASGFAFR